MNDELLDVLNDYAKWYAEKFGKPRPDGICFRSGAPGRQILRARRHL